MNSSYKPPLALTIVSGIFLLLGLIFALIIIADIILRRGWRSMMLIMISVWPINALYLGPFTLWLYLSYGRPSKPEPTHGDIEGAHSHEHPERHHHDNDAHENKTNTLEDSKAHATEKEAEAEAENNGSERVVPVPDRPEQREPGVDVSRNHVHSSHQHHQHEHGRETTNDGNPHASHLHNGGNGTPSHSHSPSEKTKGLAGPEARNDGDDHQGHHEHHQETQKHDHQHQHDSKAVETHSAPGHGGDAHGHHMHGMADDRPMWATVLIGVSHCGAGCVLGDLVGEWIAYGSGVTIASQGIWACYLIDYAFAITFGIIFQYFSIAPMSGNYGIKSLINAAKADILSLTFFEIGLFGWMAIYQVAIFDYKLTTASWSYWWLMWVGMIIGYITSFPINWYLLSAGIKEPCA